MYLLVHDVDRSNPDDHFITDNEGTGAGEWKFERGDSSGEAEQSSEQARTTVPLPHHNVERWVAISAALEAIATSQQLSVEELAAHMKSYSSPSLDLSGLESLLASEGNSSTLHELIPRMSSLALSLPQLIPVPVPLLRSNSTSSLTLSQRQAACLLANAFFCTFDEVDEVARWQRRYNTFNFERLFARYKSLPCHREEKLKCLMCYFATVLMEPMPQRNITISRATRADVPDWSSCDAPLVELHASAEGTIESGGVGMAQVDFANRFIGGGVLRGGCLQEEIRFITCPEMLVSCLVCEKMESRDAIRIEGADVYSDHKGYSSAFRWIGKSAREVQHPNPGRDGHKRLRTEVIAMDALPFRERSRQYQMELVNRELSKAFVGFSVVSSESPSRIASGNWGCGAYNGDPELKSLIQLMAASAVNREISYFTFGNAKLADGLNDVVGLTRRSGTSVAQLHEIIAAFCSLPEERKRPGLFAHVKRCLTPVTSRLQHACEPPATSP